MEVWLAKQLGVGRSELYSLRITGRAGWHTKEGKLTHIFELLSFLS